MVRAGPPPPWPGEWGMPLLEALSGVSAAAKPAWDIGGHRGGAARGAAK